MADGMKLLLGASVVVLAILLIGTASHIAVETRPRVFLWPCVQHPDERHYAARLATLVWFSNRAPSVNPSSRSPHPSLARHHPTDPVSGPAIVLSRFEGACAGPMVLSAVGTRPPHDGSSSESAFQCGSRGPRAAATKPTEWPHPRPGRD